ncbi:MAG: hypothetical protein NZM25_02305 [Leptospiraceae bacterium]|nr:hypothetical protein [Leptospiraceae bacterium]MDW8307010.1 hypothetical protein [Leptospiraceae bacterium]
MSLFASVFEFSGFTNKELAILERLSWQERSFPPQEDQLFIVLKGRLRWSKRHFFPGFLGGILPFIRNPSGEYHYIPGTKILSLATKELAYFLLENPGAMRSYLEALRIQKYDILPRYRQLPVIISLATLGSSLALDLWKNFLKNFVFVESQDFQDELSWAKFFYETCQKGGPGIVIHGELSPYINDCCQIHIVIYDEAKTLAKSLNSQFWPGVLFCVESLRLKNNTEVYLKKLKQLLEAMQERTKVFLWEEVAEAKAEALVQKLNGVLSRNTDSLQVLFGRNAFFWLGFNSKEISRLTQPIYPKKAFFDIKYTVNRLSRLLGEKNIDLATTPFLLAGPLWFGSGKLSHILPFAALPLGMFFSYDETSLINPHSRSLRLALTGSIHAAYYETLLAAKLRQRVLPQDFPFRLYQSDYEIMY